MMAKKLFTAAFIFSVWFSQSLYAGAESKVIAEVDIANQTMKVSQYGETVYRWKVSTGRDGHRTPDGTYRPQRMYRIWYSRKYNNAPMPYAIFFEGGYAIHGTNATARLGTPVSHGCVRLATDHARTFYQLVREVGMDNIEIVIRN